MAPVLMAIVDRAALGSDEALRRRLLVWAALAQSEAQLVVQLRIKQPQGRAALLRQCAADLAEQRRFVWLNGSAAEATEHGFGGVHWPEAALAAEVPVGATGAGPSLPACRSASVHSPAAAHTASRAGAKMLVFAPVFAPLSKVAKPRGLAALTEVARATELPVLALGGMLPERVAACRQAGAAGVAILGAACGDMAAQAVLRTYLAAWHAAAV